MTTAVRFIKDSAGKFAGSIPLHTGVTTIPTLPKRPPVEPQVAISDDDRDLARWDLSTADKDLLPAPEYANEQERRRAKLVGIGGFLSVNGAYLGAVTAMVTSTIPAAATVTLSLLLMPITIATASIAGRPYAESKRGTVARS